MVGIMDRRRAMIAAKDKPAKPTPAHCSLTSEEVDPRERSDENCRYH